MATISYKDIFAPSFWQAWNDFLNHKYNEMWFTGGRGCIDGDTLIDTPTGKARVRDFKGGEVLAFDNDSIHVAKADAPVRYTQENLYTVTNSIGDSIIVTDEHKFLTPSGWRMLRTLKIGDTIICSKNNALAFASIKHVKFKKHDYYWDFNVQGVHNYCAQGFINHNSTKSSFVTMCIVLGMIRDAQYAYKRKQMGDKRWISYMTHAIVYRKIAADLRISVYNQFIWSIEKLGLTQHFKFSVSPLRITYKATGQMIDFRGLDDPIKSKSIKAPFGFYKYNFFEELNQFDGIEEVRSVRQSIERGGPGGEQGAFVHLAAFNPPEQLLAWANFEARKIVPGRKVYHSDYRSVPVSWLSEQFFRQAEILRIDNEQKYRHEYLGEATGTGGNIFTNVVDRRITDAEIEANSDNLLWGCDFGMTDPTVLCGCWYSELERSIYCAFEVYKSGMLLDEIVTRFRNVHRGWNWIMADSASPQMIMELENRGLQILPVSKVRDSIFHGLQWLRSLRHIYVDQLRCPNAFQELTLYEFQKLKGTDQFTERPVAGNDHYIDSLRYATMSLAQNATLF